MVKGQSAKHQAKDKVKQKPLKPTGGSSKRGSKSKNEFMENLFDVYSTRNPPQVRNIIQGWERDCNNKEEKIETEEEVMEFIKDPGNTRGRLSLFHHSIHTYWILKCVLAKAVMILQEMGGDPQVVSILQEIKKEIQETRVSQHYATARLGRIERQLQSMQQVDMPGSNVKDPTPVESLDD